MVTVAYLSKIPINPLRRGGQRMLANPQVLHAAVLAGLPSEPGRVLWREEVRSQPRGPAQCDLLVLTPRRPDWSHIIESAGWDTEEGAPLVRELQPLLDLVVSGRQFGFRVRANPVQALSTPANPTGSQRAAMDDTRRRRGIRVAHRTAGHQLDWFLTRTKPEDARWGFTVDTEPAPQVSIVAREHRAFVKGRDVRHRVTIDRATFEGRLTVVAPERLREVLVKGLGSAKAYGCGLLTLAPVSGDVVAR